MRAWRFAGLAAVTMPVPGAASAAVWYDGPYEWGIGRFVCHSSGGRFGVPLKYTWMHQRFGPDTSKREAVAHCGPCIGGDGSTGPPTALPGSGVELA